MAFQTKIRLNDDKVEQIGGVSLTLSGDTKISSDGTIEYVSNRHGDYVNRSLVDKEYVDNEITGVTSTALTGATNGLDIAGQDVVLGGALTGSTTITGTYGGEVLNFEMSAMDFTITSPGEFKVDFATGNINLNTYDGIIGAQQILMDSVNNRIIISENSISGWAGVEYGADYSDNFVARSLIDKGYVDNEINGLTGTTSSALTGATNGLNTDTNARVVELGGALTKNTEITLSGTTQFNVEDSSDVSYFRHWNNTCTEIYQSSGVNYSLLQLRPTNAFLGVTGDGYDYGIYLNNSQIYLSSELSTNNTFIDLTPTVLTFQSNFSTFAGAQYGADYSDNFVARSLVDAAYVTGITSTIEEVSDLALTGATNGLSVSGRNAVLGGTLTGDTTILINDGTLINFRDTGNTYSFQVKPDRISISGENSTFNVINEILITHSAFESTYVDDTYNDGTYSNQTCEKISMRAYNYTLSNTDTELNICQTGEIIAGGEFTWTGFTGIKYYEDYSNNFVARSLPDVAYVTGITDGLQTEINNIDVGLTGSTNGLTDTNGIVELGGALTKPTTLSGSQIFGVNVNQINLTGTTTSCGINLGGTVSLKTEPSGTGGLLCITAGGEIQQTSLAAFGGITGATNGLTDCGNQEIGLGGTLCAATSILGAGFALDLGTAGSKLSTLSVNTSGAVGITSGDLLISSSGATFTDLSAVKEGIKYNADYSTTYVDRSLVDKGYVDAVATGLQPHEAVLAATTGNTTLSGAQTIDGISLVASDRVLVKNQTTASENGIYVVAAGAWTRATDFDDDPLTIEVKSGDLVPVLSGNTQAATIWILTTPDPITIDTTLLTFTIFSRSLSYVGGDGISITQGTGLNQTIAVDLATNSGLCFCSDKLSVASSIAGTGLSWLNGVINANAMADGVAGISVRVDGSDNLVVNTADINTALGGVLSGSTNGLTDANGVACLGGTLTTATTLIGTDTNSFTYQDDAIANKRGILYASDYSVTFIARSLVDAAYVTGITSDITTNFNTFTGNSQPVIDTAITGATNGLTKDGRNAILGGTLLSNRVFTGTASNFHLQYAADYAAAFTARSIPDAAWVTGQTTTAGLQDAENGLTKTGTTVVLGGTLTGDTIIDGNGTVGIFTINDIDSITVSSIGAVNDSGGYINLSATGAIIEGNNNVTTGARLQVNTDNSLVLTTYNAGTFSGATYGGDYSSNYTLRSLPDVDYVTGITSGIESDITGVTEITDVALTGATNGLTKSGRNATLGGDLTGNTVINGIGTHSLGLGASGSLLTTLNVHATSSNLNSTLNVTGATVLASTLNVTGATIIDGTVTLNSVVAGTASDDVLLIDSSNVVKQISAAEFGNITGATNGLSVVDRNVELGGVLTKNTVISGTSTHSLGLGASGSLLTTLNVHATSSNLNSTLNVTGATTIGGTLTLNSVAAGASVDSVLVRDSLGVVKQVDATALGEDNNNYDILIISGNTTLNETNYTVLVDSSVASITVTLPASPIDGQAYKIKDYVGDALTNNVIINGNGKSIDGGGATINTDYGALEIVFSTNTISGGGWYVMSFVN